jgi:hypothetical protein
MKTYKLDERGFPQREPKAPKNQVKATLYLPVATHELLRKIAYERHCKQHDLLMEALYQWLEHESGKTRRELTGQQEPPIQQ